MTPFDPVALLAMLLAFYDDATPANLRLARSERPEYFAGATLIGRSGDKFQLPDGRIFDCILGVEGPRPPRRWIMIDVTEPGPGGPDPFPLETGPLVPLDDTVAFPPIGGGSFEALVAGELEPLHNAGGVLDRAGVDVVEFAGARELDEAYDRDVVPAIVAHEGMRAAIALDDPSDELQAANDASGVPVVQGSEYDEPIPPDIDEPDPGPVPSDEKDGPPGTNIPK